MVLAFCLGGLALCAFAVLALYGRELRRMAAWLRTRDKHSNGRLTTEMPGPGFTAMARAVNESLDAAAAEQRQAVQAQQQFQRDLASLSHDIRTPLMGAKGYVSLATDETDPAQRAHYLSAAEARLADMEGLLNQLFAYARANDPEHALDLQTVVVLPLLADVLAGQYPAFEQRGWEPQVAFQNEALTVEADPEALARIFENLVSNALRHGAGAPSIIQQGRTLTFANPVESPGALDPARLFDRFYQADPTRTQGGAGLGLAVVASLAKAQGMEVTASLEGKALGITLAFEQEGANS